MSDTVDIDIIESVTPVVIEVTQNTPVVQITVSQIGEKGDPGDGSGGLTDANGEEFTGSTSSTLTLANTPVSGTLKLYKNGYRLPFSEFSFNGVIVTLTSPRELTDVFAADYKY